MSPTDTSEKGLESLIVASLLGERGGVAIGPAALHEALPGASILPHYVAGDWQDYDRDHAVDFAKHRSRSHDAVIRVYDEAGNVIETYEHAGDFKEW